MSMRPLLRIARRDALRARGRSALIVAMVALPVLGVSFIDVMIRTGDVDAAERVSRELGPGRRADRGVVQREPGPPARRRRVHDVADAAQRRRVDRGAPRRTSRRGPADALPRRLVLGLDRADRGPAAHHGRPHPGDLARVRLREAGRRRRGRRSWTAAHRAARTRSSSRPALLGTLGLQVGDALEVQRPDRTLTIVGTVPRPRRVHPERDRARAARRRDRRPARRGLRRRPAHEVPRRHPRAGHLGPGPRLQRRRHRRLLAVRRGAPAAGRGRPVPAGPQHDGLQQRDRLRVHRCRDARRRPGDARGDPARGRGVRRRGAAAEPVDGPARRDGRRVPARTAGGARAGRRTRCGGRPRRVGGRPRSRASWRRTPRTAGSTRPSARSTCARWSCSASRSSAWSRACWPPPYRPATPRGRTSSRRCAAGAAWCARGAAGRSPVWSPLWRCRPGAGRRSLRPRGRSGRRDRWPGGHRGADDPGRRSRHPDRSHRRHARPSSAASAGSGGICRSARGSPYGTPRATAAGARPPSRRSSVPSPAAWR